ncbi:MAG: hypothetical protein K2P17_02670 [Helicobacteraceae bacterium]|nr:hypothetical protein [Helicobacteraceae bacterium]
MKDWIFPTCAFLVFAYGMFFLNLYIYRYTNSDTNIFSEPTQVIQYDDIGNFLKEISESFK